MEFKPGQVYQLVRDGITDYVVFKSDWYAFSITSSTAYSGFTPSDKFTDTGKTLDDVLNFLK